MNSVHFQFINEAHNIAFKKFGSTFPNPVVGCVIVKNNKIISKGVTNKSGRPHAEEIAIKKAGLTWEEIREVNPKLIMLRMPAFGLSGPYRDFRGFGMHVEALLGHTHIRGYPNTSPQETGTETLASDVIAGVHGALAVAMALRHREQTGEGQLIELALAESFLPILGEFLADYDAGISCASNYIVLAIISDLKFHL